VRKLAVIAPAVALAVAACGGGGSTGTDQSTATSTPTSKVSVEITAPQDGASVKRRVVVRGLASPEDATVDVNGEAAHVRAGRFSATVQLSKGDGSSKRPPRPTGSPIGPS
jgi:hypothetical protein